MFGRQQGLPGLRDSRKSWRWRRAPLAASTLYKSLHIGNYYHYAFNIGVIIVRLAACILSLYSVSTLSNARLAIRG